MRDFKALALVMLVAAGCVGAPDTAETAPEAHAVDIVWRRGFERSDAPPQVVWSSRACLDGEASTPTAFVGSGSGGCTTSYYQTAGCYSAVGGLACVGDGFIAVNSDRPLAMGGIVDVMTEALTDRTHGDVRAWNYPEWWTVRPRAQALLEASGL